jgi:hypothetical protein
MAQSFRIMKVQAPVNPDAAKLTRYLFDLAVYTA